MHTTHNDALPELILIGKAGAGKSTLFAALGGPRDRVGDGLRPSGAGPASVALPPDAPVLRLTDTAALHPGSPAPEDAPGRVWLAVARLDDPVQAPLGAALAGLRGARRAGRVALALTGADRLADPGARERAAAALRAELARAAGGPLPDVVVGGVEGVAPLVALLAGLLPAAGALGETEAQAFARNRPLVLRHVAGAGAADLFPLVGAVAVPAAQAAMLAALARALGVTWTPARTAAFAGALGGAAVVRQGAGLALRQGAKLVPVVGQTLGAALAAAASGAATYALGRAGHAWLWAQARGVAMDTADLRAVYARALAEGARDAAG